MSLTKSVCVCVCVCAARLTDFFMGGVPPLPGADGVLGGGAGKGSSTAGWNCRGETISLWSVFVCVTWIPWLIVSCGCVCVYATMCANTHDILTWKASAENDLPSIQASRLIPIEVSICIYVSRESCYYLSPVTYLMRLK